MRRPNRAFGNITTAILYDGDKPDSMGTYFEKHDDGMRMMVWSGDVFLMDKIITEEVYKAMVNGSGYK